MVLDTSSTSSELFLATVYGPNEIYVTELAFPSLPLSHLYVLHCQLY
jgi:hypothetical protein